VVDPGPRSGTVYLQDEDYAWRVDHILTGRGRSREFWVFAYGSLIWKPEFAAVEERIAHAYGWHRAFALKMTRWRGSPERPGLMLALDRGGACKGIAYRLPEDGLIEALGKLLRREMSAKPSSNVPRWIGLESLFYGEVNPLPWDCNALKETHRRKADVII
jgi:glutathione-specific gamma-glutamylcyclotransferase